MRIGIIGGGAAGLVTAYLLRQRHEVTLFEAQEILGGNIRTLNGNVSCPSLPENLSLDAGVIEFEENRFPTLKRLLDELEVERVQVPGTTALILRKGQPIRSLGNIRHAGLGRWERIRAMFRLLSLYPAHRRFLRSTQTGTEDDLQDKILGDFLETGPYEVWLRLLLTYAYSIPYAQSEKIAANLAIPVLRAFTGKNSWTSVRGGTYEYVRKLLSKCDARILAGVGVTQVRRSRKEVQVHTSDRQILNFDKIVFAATPEQFLSLVESPTAAERHCFSEWVPNPAKTIVHWDTGMYQRRNLRYASEFDLFQTNTGGGYNAALNRLNAVQSKQRQYFLAFDMNSEIDSDKILHIQNHHTPSYASGALKHRQIVDSQQGKENTYHVGAWLGDGLHEGAVSSAAAVARSLRGHVL